MAVGVHPRAAPELPPSPPQSAGIDYLDLVAAEHERALKRPIAYRDIPTPTATEEIQ